jgi:hypothetical protein
MKLCALIYFSISAVLAQPCSHDAHCPISQWCDNGICRDDFPIGAVCERFTQCLTKHCSEGTCHCYPPWTNITNYCPSNQSWCTSKGACGQCFYPTQLGICDFDLQFCNPQNLCQVKLKHGSNCTRSWECAGGNCSSGQCKEDQPTASEARSVGAETKTIAFIFIPSNPKPVNGATRCALW